MTKPKFARSGEAGDRLILLCPVCDGTDMAPGDVSEKDGSVRVGFCCVDCEAMSLLTIDRLYGKSLLHVSVAGQPKSSQRTPSFRTARSVTPSQRHVVNRMVQGWKLVYDHDQRRAWLQKGRGGHGSIEPVVTHTFNSLWRSGLIRMHRDGRPLSVYAPVE